MLIAVLVVFAVLFMMVFFNVYSCLVYCVAFKRLLIVIQDVMVYLLFSVPLF